MSQNEVRIVSLGIDLEMLTSSPGQTETLSVVPKSQQQRLLASMVGKEQWQQWSTALLAAESQPMVRSYSQRLDVRNKTKKGLTVRNK
jgi:hypothetical protein